MSQILLKLWLQTELDSTQSYYHYVSNANLVFGVWSNLIFYLGVTTALKKPILNSIFESSEVEKVTNLWPLNT